MAYIALPEGKPGMHGLLAFRPEVAQPLCMLTDALLRSEEGLSRGERELIGAFVSSLNDKCAAGRQVCDARAGGRSS